MKKLYLITAITCLYLLGAYLLSGAEEAKPAWCTPPIQLGQSASSVQQTWGTPDAINDLGTDETGLDRQEWVYRSAPFGILTQHEYVCKTQRLIFAEGKLIKITSEDEILPYNRTY